MVWSLLRRFGSHVAHQWMGALALMLALGGGTAYALSGHNTVFSDDIVNGEVHTKDLGNRAVTPQKLNVSGGYISMGLTNQTNPDPNTGCDTDRHYTPYAGQPPGYFRDALGYVHLRGSFFPYCGEYEYLYTLPPGYRPGQTQRFGAFGSDTSDYGLLPVLVRITPDGAIYPRQSEEASEASLPATAKVSLDGLTFRCAPSGSNGCP